MSQPVRLEGVGIHTGAECAVEMRPAVAGTGVVFLAGESRIPALLRHVSGTDRRTALAKGEDSVSTVEHLLAAIQALNLDDLEIRVTGGEVPALDGSSAPFIAALRGAGIVPAGGDATVLTLAGPFTVRDGDAVYHVAPADRLRLTVTVEWDHPLIGRQSGCYDITPDTFERELAHARTFGFMHEAESLGAAGLARGAAALDIPILDETGLRSGTLARPDDFVRHKALDLLGDLALLGGRLQFDVVAFRPSHRGNLALARALNRVLAGGGPPVAGIDRIMGVLPHRYPMLLVDRIVEIEPGKRVVGIKNVTINEPFFQGHFPGHPVMPGVLIVEAMAQAGGMLLMDDVADPATKVVYFMSIDGVKFRKPVVPGDQLRMELEMLQFRGRTCRMRGVAWVDGKPVAEAEMMAMIVDR